MQPLTGLRVLALSDGKAGHAAQALGVAERLSDMVRIATALRPGLIAQVTAGGRVEAQDGAPLDEDWPQIVVSCSRISARPALRFRKAGARVIFLQKPPIAPGRFDLVAAPAHDRLSGPNVIETLGAPNRASAARLAEAAAAWRPNMAEFPKPWLSVLIGGKSKRHDLPEARARQLGEQIAVAAANAGGSVFATASRRTSPAAAAAFATALSETPGWIWDGAGENPYYGLLALGDSILVTADSVSMASEAAMAGKPILIADLPGGSARFDRFHKALEKAGHARPFTGRIERWDAPRLDDAGLVAEVARERFGL